MQLKKGIKILRKERSQQRAGLAKLLVGFCALDLHMSEKFPSKTKQERNATASKAGNYTRSSDTFRYHWMLTCVCNGCIYKKRGEGGEMGEMMQWVMG